MAVYVFGQRRDRAESNRGPPGIGYKLTQDGQFDAENKRICNLSTPVDINDVVNLITIQRAIDDVTQAFVQFQGETSDLYLNAKSEIDSILIRYNINLRICEEKIKKLEENLSGINVDGLNHG